MRRWRHTRSSLCRARADIRWHIGHILFGGLWAKFGGTFYIDTSALGLVDRSFYKRALHLWSLDNTLTIALDVCHDFMMPIQYLTGLFPCTGELRTNFVFEGTYDDYIM